MSRTLPVVVRRPRVRVGLAIVAAVASLTSLLTFAAPSAAGTPLPRGDVEGMVISTSPDSVVHLRGDQPHGYVSSAVLDLGLGFLTSADRVAERFVIRLAGPGIETFRGTVERAARIITARTGAKISVAPGRVLPTDQYRDGQVVVQTSPTSGCGRFDGRRIGCGGWTGRIRAGQKVIMGGLVWLDPDLTSRAASVRDAVVLHELGHAFGLDHYEGVYAGSRQIMYPTVSSAITTYQAGDLAGLGHLRHSDPDRPFIDVPLGSYFDEPVHWLYGRKLTTGCGVEWKYCPHDRTLRAHAITFLHRMAGHPKSPMGPSFSDVPGASYYAAASRWGRGTGLTTGVGGTNRFEPDRPVTRAEFVTLLHRYAGTPKVGRGRAFVDVPAASYFADAVNWAVAKGITTGVGGDARFAPHQTASRAEVATFLYRFLVNVKSEAR